MNFSTSTNTDLDTTFLDKNGYVIIKNLITPDHLKKVKLKLSEIQKSESIRSGGFGFSPLRDQLLRGNKKNSLFFFDTFYYLLKQIIHLSIKIIPPLKQALYFHRSTPFNPLNSGYLKNEIHQMLICIIEQLDNKDSIRTCDLANKGEEFDVFYQNEQLLNHVKHIIGEDYKLSSLNIRSPKKGNTNQDLHVDFPWAVKGNQFYACNALFVLDDMNESNGATRVIPGSHRSGKMPYDEISDLKANHPDQILIKAKAGDVIFLNSHVWHGGSSNITGKQRTVIQSYFVHRAHQPQQYQRFQIRPSTLKRLNNKSLKILDIH